MRKQRGDNYLISPVLRGRSLERHARTVHELIPTKSKFEILEIKKIRINYRIALQHNSALEAWQNRWVYYAEHGLGCECEREHSYCGLQTYWCIYGHGRYYELIRGRQKHRRFVRVWPCVPRRIVTTSPPGQIEKILSFRKLRSHYPKSRMLYWIPG